jgi:hypothetical protein
MYDERLQKQRIKQLLGNNAVSRLLFTVSELNRPLTLDFFYTALVRNFGSHLAR